jgi:hypothetical protein
MELHPEESQKFSSEVTLNINGCKSHLWEKGKVEQVTYGGGTQF